MAKYITRKETLDVEQTMRNLLFDLWQRGEKIRRDATELPGASERLKLITDLFYIGVKTRSGKLNFRDVHARIEKVARAAMANGPPPRATPP